MCTSYNLQNMMFLPGDEDFQGRDEGAPRGPWVQGRQVELEGLPLEGRNLPSPPRRPSLSGGGRTVGRRPPQRWLALVLDEKRHQFEELLAGVRVLGGVGRDVLEGPLEVLVQGQLPGELLGLLAAHPQEAVVGGEHHAVECNNLLNERRFYN